MWGTRQEYPKVPFVYLFHSIKSKIISDTYNFILFCGKKILRKKKINIEYISEGKCAENSFC